MVKPEAPECQWCGTNEALVDDETGEVDTVGWTWNGPFHVGCRMSIVSEVTRMHDRMVAAALQKGKDVPRVLNS